MQQANREPYELALLQQRTQERNFVWLGSVMKNGIEAVALPIY